jgi:spermidine/putrescine transport system ATP-binding protein
MLKIVNIGKKFGSQTALESIDLEIQDGEFFSLLGPSGCGKTTLLRIIAGFENPTSGQIFWNDTRIDTLRPQERPFNMVFQKYALFPHMSLFDNVAFGLRVEKRSEPDIAKLVQEALELVGLWELRERRPETLSGGQAQRIAVARAIVKKPKILLLDEPLSALDQKMREHMQTELRELQRRVGITFIFVTHDQEEALALSDRVAVMNRGHLEQVSSPEALYGRPETSFVAQFIGSSGALGGRGLVTPSGQGQLTLENGDIVKGQAAQLGPHPTSATAIVRPENIWLHLENSPQAESAHQNRLRGTVHTTVFKGSQREVQVDICKDTRLRVFVRDAETFAKAKAGQSVQIAFSAQDTFIYPSET